MKTTKEEMIEWAAGQAGTYEGDAIAPVLAGELARLKRATLIVELTKGEATLLRQAKEDLETGWIANPRYPAGRLAKMHALFEKIASALPEPTAIQN